MIEYFYGFIGIIGWALKGGEALSEVKTFRISGWVSRGFGTLKLFKEVRALTVKEALEKFYNDVGSNHKLKRCQIKNIMVEEIKPEEARNPVTGMLAGVEEAK